MSIDFSHICTVNSQLDRSLWTASEVVNHKHNTDTASHVFPPVLGFQSMDHTENMSNRLFYLKTSA